MEIRSLYSPKERVQFNTVGPSMTHQSMKDETDMNRIMEKWAKTGVLEHRNTYEGQYGDFMNAPEDYHSAMNAVIEAQDMFSELPANVRKRFANDPGLFLDFVSDPKNRDEMKELGLVETNVDLEVIEKTEKTTKTSEKEPPEPKKDGEKPAD